MTDLTIRPAHPGELAAVGDLTVRAYLADGPISEKYTAMLADASSRARDAELLVAVDSDDHLLGTVTIALPGGEFADVARDGELEFRMLAVDPSARRRGVGEALVRTVIDRARFLGLPRVILSSQQTMTAAHRIYERFGFRRHPDRDWVVPPNLKLIVFVLDLD
jgi:ribosomal protein S18 acetylase RimI-like enzyme